MRSYWRERCFGSDRNAGSRKTYVHGRNLDWLNALDINYVTTHIDEDGVEWVETKTSYGIVFHKPVYGWPATYEARNAGALKRLGISEDKNE